jgi:hypothetical protein
MLKNQTVKLFLLGILTLVITMGMVLLLGKVTVGKTGSECNQTQCDTTKCDQHVGK